MNRSLRSAAAAGAVFCVAATAAAQTPAPVTNVRLYGLVDMAAGRFQAPGGPRIYRAESGGMSTSFWGLAGTEDLGGGVRARFVLESFHRPDTGSSGRLEGQAFFTRNAYASLSGAFGSTAVGLNTTPLFLSTLLYNAFGDSFTFSPSVRQYYGSPALPGGAPTGVIGDITWRNSLLYVSNRNDGLGFTFLINAGEGAPNALRRNLSAGLSYLKGPVALSLVGEQVRNATTPLPAGFDRQNTYQLGGSYDFGFAKAYAQYGKVRTESALAATDAASRITGVGLAVPVGAGRVLGQVGHSKTTTAGVAPATLRTASVGYNHFLSRQTDVYAVYMHERTSYATPATANTVAAGIRLRF